MSTTYLAQERENFLLPNGTFIVETIIILVVLFIFFRYIVPPVRQAMRERNEMVQRSMNESRFADEKFAAADERHREALNEARSEAGRIRDAARADGQRIIDELREQANAEVAEIRRQGAEQLAAQREQVVSELEPHARQLAVELASRVVGEKVGAGRRKS